MTLGLSASQLVRSVPKPLPPITRPKPFADDARND